MCIEMMNIHTSIVIPIGVNITAIPTQVITHSLTSIKNNSTTKTANKSCNTQLIKLRQSSLAYSLCTQNIYCTRIPQQSN